MDWISQLMIANPEALPPNPDAKNRSGASGCQCAAISHFASGRLSPRATKRPKTEGGSSNSGGSFTSTPGTPPPPLPHGLPLTSSSSHPLHHTPTPMTLPQQTTVNTSSTGAASSVRYLPAFHERCAQRRFNVEYQDDNIGLPHAPRWVITCIVNGVLKGQGQGPSKQIAKEEAAKNAYHALGFE